MYCFSTYEPVSPKALLLLWLLLPQMAFIIVAGICACLYFLFLCFMVFQVFRNISCKRTSLPAMSKARRLHYEVRFFDSLVSNSCSCSTSKIKISFFLLTVWNQLILFILFRVWFSGSSSSCWSHWPALPWLSSSSLSVRWMLWCFKTKSHDLHS